MDYCEGYFEPNGTASGAKKNTTECSNTTLLFNFDPEKVLSEQLNSTGLNVTLSDLGWPDALTDGIHALRIAFKVMFVFYIIAIIFTGLSVLGALIGVILSGRLSAFANWALSLVSLSHNQQVMAAVLTSVFPACLPVSGHRIRNFHCYRRQSRPRDQQVRRRYQRLCFVGQGIHGHDLGRNRRNVRRQLYLGSRVLCWQKKVDVQDQGDVLSGLIACDKIFL